MIVSKWWEVKSGHIFLSQRQLFKGVNSIMLDPQPRDTAFEAYRRWCPVKALPPGFYYIFHWRFHLTSYFTMESMAQHRKMILCDIRLDGLLWSIMRPCYFWSWEDQCLRILNHLYWMLFLKNWPFPGVFTSWFLWTWFPVSFRDTLLFKYKKNLV